MTSLSFRIPKLYNLILRLAVGKTLNQRYKEVSKIIGKNKKVLELGCGTCNLFKFLDKSCKYEGWDLNKRFIKYNKKRGINVKLKNVYDYKNYPKSDIIVIIDLLHHIIPRHEELIKNVRNKADKLIIIEPHVSHITSNKVLRFFTKLWLKTLGDDDGINNINNILKWYKTKREVYEFFLKFNPKLIKEIGPDYLVII